MAQLEQLQSQLVPLEQVSLNLAGLRFKRRSRRLFHVTASTSMTRACRSDISALRTGWLDPFEDGIISFSVCLTWHKKKTLVMADAERKTTTMTWIGLGLMGVQFGALARLTWWEYSWDIMEPITYFVTYGTSMACFAYYVLTKQVCVCALHQNVSSSPPPPFRHRVIYNSFIFILWGEWQEYLLPDVRDREYLLQFHKKAKKIGMDVAEYNRLQEAIARVESDLKRLRDPLRVHHPPADGQSLDHLTIPPANSQLVSTNLWNRTQLRLQRFLKNNTKVWLTRSIVMFDRAMTAIAINAHRTRYETTNWLF